MVLSFLIWTCTCPHVPECMYRYVCISFLLSPSTPHIQYPLLTLHSLLIPPTHTPTHSYHCWSLWCTLSIPFWIRERGLAMRKCIPFTTLTRTSLQPHSHTHFPPTTLTHTLPSNHTHTRCPADFIDRMGVWILDGVVWHSQLLPFVLTRDTIEHTTVMIVVDLSQPWNIMESLERWAEVVRRHVNSLQIPERQLRQMEEKSE